eukprot:5893286-Pleurochrysis_carterae.AAC.1
MDARKICPSVRIICGNAYTKACKDEQRTLLPMSATNETAAARPKCSASARNLSRSSTVLSAESTTLFS